MTDAFFRGVAMGQRDALAGAVARVEALVGVGAWTPGVGSVLGRAAVIAAILGEAP